MRNSVKKNLLLAPTELKWRKKKLSSDTFRHGTIMNKTTGWNGIDFNIKAQYRSTMETGDLEESEKSHRGALKVDKLNIKVDIQSDKEREKGIKEVFSIWSRTEDAVVQNISAITSGITNFVYRVDLAGKRGSYLFRIYGKKSEILIDREHAKEWNIEIGEQGFCPITVCVFQNGSVEQFFNAHTLKAIDLRLPKYQSSIAVQFSKMHTYLTLSTADQTPGLPAFYEKLKNIIQGIDLKSNPWRQSEFANFDFKIIFDDMEMKLAYLEECYHKLGSKKFTFDQNKLESEYWARELLLKTSVAHNDLIAGNILFTTDTKKIVFIDFEYAFYNHVGFDIANHFNEYTDFFGDFRKWYPPRDMQIQFFQAYWSVPGSLPKDFKMSLFESDVFWDRVIWWTNYFAYVSHYVWGLWGICQAAISTKDFDFIAYAKFKLIDAISFHNELLSV